MDCRRAEPLLSAWLDGELGAAEARALDAHVSGCPGCRGKRKELTAARDLFQQMAPERSSLRAADVLARLPKSAPPSSAPARRGARWLPLAAALALAGAGLWQGRLWRSETTVRTEARIGGFQGLDCGPDGGPGCRRLACFDAAECDDGADGSWPPLAR